MSLPIQVTRNSHIEHLAKSMPFIMLLFVAQIYIIKESYPQEKLGNYSLFCAFTICSYITTLFFYNKKTITLLHADKIETHSLFGKKIEVNYSDIEKVIGPDSERSFSTIVICTKKGVVPLRFIDNPIEIQNKIMSLKRNSESFSQAA